MKLAAFRFCHGSVDGAIGAAVVIVHYCRLGVAVVAYLQLSVLVIEELAPAVGSTFQEIVVALVILHQIGEDVLLPAFNDMLQSWGIRFQINGHFCPIVVWQDIVVLLSRYDLTQCFGHKCFAVLFDGQLVVWAIDGQLQVELCLEVEGLNSLYVVVVTYREISVLVGKKLHSPVQKQFFHQRLRGRLFFGSPRGLLCDMQRGGNDIRAIHLFVEADVLDAHLEILCSRRFAIRHLTFDIALLTWGTTRHCQRVQTLSIIVYGH